MAVKCTCIEKFRDKQGRIKGYRLQDQQGKCIDVTPDNLKMAIFGKQFNVINLQLTSDGRLIDKEVKQPTPKQKVQKNKADSTTTGAFEELLHLVNYYYQPDEDIKHTDRRFERLGLWNEKGRMHAIDLLNRLGISVKTLKYSTFSNDMIYRYCVGKSLITFTNYGIEIIAPNVLWYYNSFIGCASGRRKVYETSQLVKVVKYLRSPENNSGICYYELYKIVIDCLEGVNSQLGNIYDIVAEESDEFMYHPYVSFYLRDKGIETCPVFYSKDFKVPIYIHTEFSTNGLIITIAKGYIKKEQEHEYYNGKTHTHCKYIYRTDVEHAKKEIDLINGGKEALEELKDFLYTESKKALNLK